jgi:hypothetical protein
MMTHLRTFALIPLSAALLVGSAVPTLAAPAPKAATTATSAGCRVPAADEVLTAQDSLRLVAQCRTVSPHVKTWHWMGNYGSVYTVVSVANQLKIVPGGLITEANSSGGGLIPTFMYY